MISISQEHLTAMNISNQGVGCIYVGVYPLDKLGAGPSIPSTCSGQETRGRPLDGAPLGLLSSQGGMMK